MARRPYAAALLLALLGAAAPAAPATADVEFPAPPSGPVVDVAAAPVVVVGTAGRPQVAWSPDHREIVTLTPFHIERTERGRIAGDIVVRTRGGRLPDGTRQVTEHQPAFRDGDRSRLFLHHSAGAWELEGDDQGKQDATPSRTQALLPGETCGDGFCSYGPGWPRGMLPIPYKVNPNTPDVTGEESAIQAGFQVWEDDPGSSVRWTYTGTTNIDYDALDDTNAVFWKSSADNYVGATTTFYNDNGEIIHFDMELNDRWQWAFQASPSTFDIQFVATHESGHALGLGHVDDDTQVMYPRGEPARAIRVPGLGDLNGIRSLYPATASGGTTDPQDADGPVDIKSVRHFFENERVTYELESYRTFVPADVVRATWNLDFNGDGAGDACIRVSYQGPDLVGNVFGAGCAGQPLGGAAVYHPRRMLSVAVARSVLQQIGLTGTRYQYTVDTMTSAGADQVAGPVVHELTGSSTTTECPGHGGDPRADVVGTPGNDRLVGTAGAIVCGLGGNDILVAAPGGGTLLEGGDGSDVLCARQNAPGDILDGGPGIDRIRPDNNETATGERFAPVAFCG